MNDEPQYSLCTVIAVACWASTALLILSAWAAWLMGAETHLALLIAETGCAMSAVAAVVQIRCFSARVYAQIHDLRVDMLSEEVRPRSVRRL